MNTNKYYAYLYKVEGNKSTRLSFEKDSKAEIISFCINKLGSYDFAMLVSEKQRNDRALLQEFYQKAKSNKGITVFFEPTTFKQLQYVNVDLSYYKHKLSNV